MSRANPGEKLSKMHLYLDADDMQWYKENFGNTTGLSKAVRAILRSYRKRIEATTQQGHKRIELVDSMKDEILQIASEDHRGQG